MKKLQVYLIDELSMRYDVNLFQFILNLLAFMCFVQECMNMPGWVVESDYKKVSGNSERNLNMQQYAGKTF